MGVAQRLGVLERLHRVQGLAGLGDGDHQVARVGIGGAVAVLAGDLHAARQPGDGLDPVARGHAGVVARATGQDLHAGDAGQHLAGARAEQAGREAAGIDGGLDGVAQRARLLVDLLLHEVPVRAQLQRGQRDVGHMHLALHGRIGPVEHRHALAGHIDSVALLQEDHLARGLEDGRHVGSDEVLALPRPTSSGQPMRAATRRPGSSRETTASA